MTYEEAQAIIRGWQEIPALNLAPGVEFCPADGTALAVVEDIEGKDDHRCILAGLYRCPKCGWVYFQQYEWEVIGNKHLPQLDQPTVAPNDELLAKVRKLAKITARLCPGCRQPVTHGDEWRGHCPHCDHPLLSLATPPAGWDQEGDL
jgi:hypothetical protein